MIVIVVFDDLDASLANFPLLDLPNEILVHLLQVIMSIGQVLICFICFVVVIFSMKSGKRSGKIPTLHNNFVWFDICFVILMKFNPNNKITLWFLLVSRGKRVQGNAPDEQEAAGGSQALQVKASQALALQTVQRRQDQAVCWRCGDDQRLVYLLDIYIFPICIYVYTFIWQIRQL